MDFQKFLMQSQISEVNASTSFVWKSIFRKEDSDNALKL